MPNTARKKWTGLVQIIRPELPLAAGLCVVIGELLALEAFPGLSLAARGFAIGFFLSASAMVFNDYFDLEVDRVNAPHRPLPGGLLSGGEAVGLGILAALAGLAAAWSFSALVLAISLLTWLVGFLYNWKLKTAGLLGNLMVALSVAMTFLVGAAAAGQPGSRMVWVFAGIVLFFDLGEEIAADAMDMEGDRKRGSRSLAILYGRRAAVRTAALLFGVVILISLLPVLWGEAGLVYLAPILIIDLLIVFFTGRLLASRDRIEGLRAIRGLYLSGSVGLLAFLIASFFA
jgi:geranylgeranylglycerol-phosphate geranylgeranyltransferase